MPERSRYGKGSGTNFPAEFQVLYVTNASTDPFFIPGNQKEGDNPDSASDAERLADCKNLVGQRADASEIGKAVQPKTLNDW
jgi:hypothetical protein